MSYILETRVQLVSGGISLTDLTTGTPKTTELRAVCPCSEVLTQMPVYWGGVFKLPPAKLKSIWFAYLVGFLLQGEG